MNKYIVKKTEDNFEIDSNYNRKEWSEIQPIVLLNTMGDVPQFLPNTEIKMMYNEKFIYIIFKVKDKYIRSVNKTINSPVSNDSCVEFFFTPSIDVSAGYFNLEINAGGTPLFRFQKRRNIDKMEIDLEDIKSIKIAHSLPKIIDPEIIKPTDWTIECRIPIDMLKKYFKMDNPSSGVIWRANFYKCGDETSNIHYLTWNKVENEIPDFHLPEYFGEIEFE